MNGPFTDDELDALAAVGTVRRYERGLPLFHKGQEAGDVVFIRDGRLKVCGATAEGREFVLAFRGPGELVGELAALDGEPRLATLVPLEPMEGIVVARGEFRRFLAEHPRAALSLMSLLARRLRDADAKRIEFAALDTLGRVASRLLELCDRFGEPEGDAIDITLPLSQEELAGWTGSSLESVGKALATMRGLGWVETRRRRFRVLDEAALRQAAR